MKYIILAFPKPETSAKIKRMLESAGYNIICICRSKAELIRAALSYDDSLIIMSFMLRDGTANDVHDELPDGQPIAVIIKAEQQASISYGDIFTISLPLNRTLLINSVELLTGSIERRKSKGVRSAEERKIIEKAKLFLMEEHNMSEQQAHRFIQKRSMDTGAKFIDTAKMILGL